MFQLSSVRRNFEESNPKLLQGLILGDSGYPLREWLQTPLLNPRNDDERRFLGRSGTKDGCGIHPFYTSNFLFVLLCTVDNINSFVAMDVSQIMNGHCFFSS